MANKKTKDWNVYAIAQDPGTKTLKEFLASTPSAEDINQLITSYAQKEESSSRTKGVQLLLDTKKVEPRRLKYAIQFACQKNYADTVAILLAHKKIDLNDPDEDAILSETALGKNTECALLLLKFGADPNFAKSRWPAFTDEDDIPAKKDGPSPLLNAIRAGDATLVQALMEAKVDVNAATQHHRRPLDVALELSQKKIADLLVKAGAKKMSPRGFVDFAVRDTPQEPRIHLAMRVRQAPTTDSDRRRKCANSSNKSAG